MSSKTDSMAEPTHLSSPAAAMFVERIQPKPPPLAPWLEATAPVDVGGIASST